MSVLTISQPVTLACSECIEGHYVEVGPDRAQCPECSNAVVPSFDVERFLEWNERMVWVDMDGVRALAYFTEETEEEEGIDF